MSWKRRLSTRGGGDAAAVKAVGCSNEMSTETHEDTYAETEDLRGDSG